MTTTTTVNPRTGAVTARDEETGVEACSRIDERVEVNRDDALRQLEVKRQAAHVGRGMG